MKKTFRTTLLSRGPGGAWTYLAVPFNVQEFFGSKARVAVRGTINGFPFRNSLLPQGDGTHSLTVSKELQAGAKAEAGETVRVVIEKDDEDRVLEVPPDLEQALRDNQGAASTFATMTYSQKKEYTDWLSSARQQSTRTARIQKAIVSLASGRKRLR